MTVGEMLERMSSRELGEWAAFEMIEGPIGGWRDDYRAALVASMVGGLGGAKKGVDHYLPKWDQVKVQPTEAELKAKAFGIFGQLASAQRGQEKP
jgi:hypothetical protein